MNVEPGPLTVMRLYELEKKLRASLDVADARIHAHDAEMVMIGMLPTLQLEHLDREWITANPRYELLNEQIFARARRGHRTRRRRCRATRRRRGNPSGPTPIR